MKIQQNRSQFFVFFLLRERFGISVFMDSFEKKSWVFVRQSIKYAMYIFAMHWHRMIEHNKIENEEPSTETTKAKATTKKNENVCDKWIVLNPEPGACVFVFVFFAHNFYAFRSDPTGNMWQCIFCFNRKNRSRAKEGIAISSLHLRLCDTFMYTWC